MDDTVCPTSATQVFHDYQAGSAAGDPRSLLRDDIFASRDVDLAEKVTQISVMAVCSHGLVFKCLGDVFLSFQNVPVFDDDVLDCPLPLVVSRF